MNFIKFFLILILFSQNIWASQKPAEVVENFDLRYYHPQLMSLKDLAFEIRISNLKENVLKSIPLSKLDDLYYEVYWITPGKYHVEVKGLPKGYIELRNELKALIQNRLDYVLPQKLAPKVRSYSLEAMSSEGGMHKILGTDKTHQRGINKIEIAFDREGKLRSFKTRSPVGSQTSELNMSKKSWSKNKWVVDEITVVSVQGIQVTRMENKLTYKKFEGFGFPTKVEVTTTQELKVATKKSDKKNKRTIKSEILFSNYKVNKGIAKRKIMDQSAKK